MELKIYSEKVEFNESKLGNAKECLFVEFPNCVSTRTGKPFKWMPTYRQLAEIFIKLREVEEKSWQKVVV